MNRLLITILLVLAVAFSVSRFAHAAPGSVPPAPTSGETGKAQAAPKQRQGHPARPKPAEEPQAEQQDISLSDICDSSDCQKETVKTDKKEVDYTPSLETSSDGKNKIRVEVHCNECAVQGMDPIEADIPRDVRLDKNNSQIKDIVTKAKQQAREKFKVVQAKSKAEQKAQARIKYLEKTCQVKSGQSTYEIDEDGKIDYTLAKFDSSSKDKDDDFDSDLKPSSSDSVSERESCFEANLLALDGSKDKEDQKALGDLLGSFEDKLSSLSQKKALGTITPAEAAELNAMAKFQTESITTSRSLSKAAADIWIAKINDERNTLAEAFKQADALKASNPGQSWQILQSQLNGDIAAKYAADMKLALAATNSAAKTNSDYQGPAQDMAKQARDPQDLISQVNAIAAKIPQKVKTENTTNSNGLFSSIASSNSGTSSIDPVTDAQKKYDETLRQIRQSFGMGALDKSHYELEPSVSGLTLDTNTPARFKVNNRTASTAYSNCGNTGNMMANSVPCAGQAYNGQSLTPQLQSFPQSQQGVMSGTSSNFSGFSTIRRN